MKEKTRRFLLKWFNRLDRHNVLRLLSDKTYLKIRFKLKFDKTLNLKEPKTFNEKMQWLKLYNRRPEYCQLVDKHAVKQYVEEKIGAKYVIPTIGIWERFDDIDFDALPESFVLKSTHDSGGVVVCKNKSLFNIEVAKKKINKSLSRNYYWHGREWPYKKVRPRIIAEQYMKDGENDNLPVYKFFCFGGKPVILQSIQNDKQANETIDYFDVEWNKLSFRQNYPNSEIPFDKPKKLTEMLNIAEKLAKNQGFIRVDLYSINDEVFFSEFTLYSDSGFAKFDPEEWDYKLGELIKLPKI